MSTHTAPASQELNPSMSARAAGGRMVVAGPMEPTFDTVLTHEALDFLATLHSEFLTERRVCCRARGPPPGDRPR